MGQSVHDPRIITILIPKYKVTMETGSYKEFDSKPKSTKFYAILLSLVTVVLCTLLGVGVWVIVYSSEVSIPVQKSSKVVEEIILVETPKKEDKEEAPVFTKISPNDKIETVN